MKRVYVTLLALLLGLFGIAAANAAPGNDRQHVYLAAAKSLSQGDKEALNMILDGLEAGKVSPIDDLAGIYTKVWNRKEKDIDVLRIAKLSPTTAYFELSPIEDPAGAYISGIADLQPDGSLLYREDNPQLARAPDPYLFPHGRAARDHYWCKLGIHFPKMKIAFTDPPDPQAQDEKGDPRYFTGACGALHGSARGGLFETAFSRRTRRTLTARQIAHMVTGEDFQRAMVWREMYLQGVTPNPE